ncbi:biphenyl-2,3-diol 1,2-dioxygenase 1-like [Ylistrum balloti]|uniref:biphenyl-2,3-diol 1,2-dioxygenase 1-like n=1 Tax=Ylistrum balloti TaxID=509963 RepID=UPI00290586CC|nr:biphenyl-2,3-diol 1,2-dioxygenase 1-like [Ylistrum balloti]
MNGITQLGYIGFEVSNLPAWKQFTTLVLGLELSEQFDNGGFSLRMDSHQHRFFITPGSADDLVLLGFQVDSQQELERLQKCLTASNIHYTHGSPEEVAHRGVKGLIKLIEPGGVAVEVYYGPTTLKTEFVSDLVTSGFVAETYGLGHVALRATNLTETEHFFCQILGFKLSDRIICNLGGFDINITFLHVNPRHHSIAFGTGLPKHIHHFMLQTRSIDDVGAAMDRTAKYGLKIQKTLGRHPNDKMLTFYGETPSGFEFEFGTGGLSIDEQSWIQKTHRLVSEWGHQPPTFYLT